MINGGDAKATGYGSAAGIGGSLYGTVGNITITDGVTRVIAVKGEYAPNSIGGGREADGVGAVTIAGVVVDGVAASPFEFSPDKIFEVVFDKNGGEGTMDKQKLVYGLRAPLSLNAFTRKEHSFTGWNTESDGSGFAFADGDRDLSLDAVSGAVTLYAQWIENKANVVNLQTLSENTSVPNGITLTGALSGEYKISIEDGAKVILNGVNINGVNSSDYKWAGITCEGDCEIVLAENSVNNVKGFHEDYPGIHVPEGKTLVISGSGVLHARSSGKGAGIGGAFKTNGGDIEISGGTIMATGGLYAAGIGSGTEGVVGNITITADVAKVTATKGREVAPNSVGGGHNASKIGTITIGGDVKTDGVKEATCVYPRTDYVAVQIRECDGRTCAIIDANYDGNEGPISIPEAVKVDSIVYNRNLTPLTPATTVLPFTLPAGTTYNAKFYKLDVVKDQNCSWKASMSNIGDELPQANKPYAVILNKGEMLLKFNMPKGEKAILQTKEIDDQTEENGKWIFRGVYSFKIWQSGDEKLELGLAYAFAGSNKVGVPKGMFGRVSKGTYASPMRAYLRKIDENVRLSSCPATVCARGAASYSVSTGLPENIDVEFVDENKKTTAMGRLNTVTGEIRIDKWFDLKGRSVGNKTNKARGAYYGKMVK